MTNNHLQTSTQANYRILDLIEQMVAVAPKGTDLGLCDLISALLSGYFIESRGAVMPAVEAFLRQEVKDEQEREARSRRAAKALTYGNYNLKEFMDKLQEIIEVEGQWQPIRVQGYRIMPVDFTAYRRAAVKKLKAKAYVADTYRAVAAVPIGLLASVGLVNGQRVALLKNAVLTDLNSNDGAAHTKRLYQQVAMELAEDELAVLDAGFSLVASAQTGIDRCLIRLAKNSTFGKTAGRIPERTAAKGRTPSQYQAETVRPLARQHTELGWDEFQAIKLPVWEHHLALTILASWFITETRLDWSRRFARDPELLAHYEVEVLPALSMANVRAMLMAAMPLPQLSSEEATYLVVKHLDNRTRSSKSRLRSGSSP